MKVLIVYTHSDSHAIPSAGNIYLLFHRVPSYRNKRYMYII
nr:MAG TPA: hypothetical protein [Caudoviricetes sp.]